MLSLSSALANLPLEDVADSVRREVLEMLPSSGHDATEAAFLGHMLEVRDSGMPEPALAEADRTFKTIVQAGSVSEADIARAREVTTAATSVLDDVGMRTMLTLLDHQTEFERYCTGVDGIARMVPRLIEREQVRPGRTAVRRAHGSREAAPRVAGTTGARSRIAWRCQSTRRLPRRWCTRAWRTGNSWLPPARSCASRASPCRPRSQPRASCSSPTGSTSPTSFSASV